MRTTRALAITAAIGMVGAVALPFGAGAGIAERTKFFFATSLRGSAEVPGPGDPDGRGFAFIRVDTEDGEICFNILALRIDPATAAHIHEGGPNEAGPVVQGLTPPTNRYSSGCVVNPGLANEIAADPDDYYVNVHNAVFPAGALRGQLD